MRASLRIAALATAALVSGVASATQIVVGESRLVIDVEFWGRARIVTSDKEGGNETVTFGDPVRGKFRIFADDAPPPRPDLSSTPPSTRYGQPSEGAPPTRADFVTSRWLSPFPKSAISAGITHDVAPFPGSVANDYVVLADRVRFGSDALQDHFQIADRFSPSSLEDTRSGEFLLMNLTAPLDFIQGTGLDQEFELDDLQETVGSPAGGFFRARVGDVVEFFEFAVDRIRGRPRVCKP
jgi:hypothetical protein